MRSRTTFKKRQKELARQEKQRDKAARREQRRLDKQSGVAEGPAGEDSDDLEAEAEAESAADEARQGG